MSRSEHGVNCMDCMNPVTCMHCMNPVTCMDPVICVNRMNLQQHHIEEPTP